MLQHGMHVEVIHHNGNLTAEGPKIMLLQRRAVAYHEAAFPHESVLQIGVARQNVLFSMRQMIRLHKLNPLVRPPYPWRKHPVVEVPGDGLLCSYAHSGVYLPGI